MVELSVNARPRTSILNIKLDTSTLYKAVLWDIEGDIHQEFFLGSLEENIEILDLPETIYILQIFDMNGQMITYKIFQKFKDQSRYDTIYI